MTLYCINKSYRYELEKLLRLFVPDERITIEKELPDGEIPVPYAFVQYDSDMSVICAGLDTGDGPKERARRLSSEDTNAEIALASELFELLCEEFSYRPSWGILTGVRPGKLMSSLRAGMGDGDALSYFENIFKVSGKKAELALEVAKAEEKIVSLSVPESFSLYVSIPFCPTRCAYCSFVSHSVSSQSLKKSIPRYVELMCEEIRHTGRIAKENGLRLESVYWGGGTPTTLDAPLLRNIFDAIGSSFDLSTVREYTVEAGRPDTITKEKLIELKEHGAKRICINPQTFNDAVLARIGRCHTSRQTVEAYEKARSLGFDNINADLIAALPGDTPESFSDSVQTAIALGFDSITVHTLSKKSSSYLATNKIEIKQTALLTADMLRRADLFLRAASYKPYYMYRQSKTVGNFENVGWAKEKKECLYNVFMMEECHSVFAVGAGAVTRLREPKGPYIERIYNFKYPYEYLTGFDEILARKNRISEFYRTYSI